MLDACRRGSGLVRVDLGLREARVSESGGFCRVSSGIFEASVRLGDVEEAVEEAGERDVIVVQASGELVVAEIRGEHYYRLVSLGETAPTLEIDGIHMHRVSETTPWADAELKVRLAGVRRGYRVLDVCTGLGYTAIHSLLRGATSVTTIEVDENVLTLAELNPWSELLGDPRVVLIKGNAVEVVGELKGSYHVVIHDPPRFASSTGELYSVSFYRELYRLLARGGRLFHYTGEPGRARGAQFPSRVASKLEEAGFRVLRYDSRALGVVAVKL
ncbi:MAG: hypothetical protein QXS85_00610 [Acidilobaceae archaeon]